MFMRSLNHGLREKEQERIAMENMGIATRLESIRPVYDTTKVRTPLSHDNALRH